jgi:hypothetical protein
MMMTKDDAAVFAARWLPAWSGNQPERLAAFYAEDAFYLDPAVPEGITGKAALLDYFRRLLAHNPDWIWLHLEAIPMEGGFLNKWLARVPVEGKVLDIVGVCLVQLDGQGLIKRNEVYFDRTELMAELANREKEDD